MSRGHGWIQRAILTELDALESGEPLLIGSDWSSGRRAAQSLADKGLISARLMLIRGRWCLVAERLEE